MGDAESQASAAASRASTWASTKDLTSHRPPSRAEVFNRARAEKPGVYNWIIDAGVWLRGSQVFQEHCCGAPSPHTTGDTCDSWNRSCIPKTRAEPHRCRVGKLLPFLPEVCVLGWAWKTDFPHWKEEFCLRYQVALTWCSVTTRYN